MKIPPAFIALLLPVTALANGGGYTYGIAKVGSLGLFQPTNAGQVEMQTELLEIELGVERAKVTVEYTLHNPGKSVTVEAGFPITSKSRGADEEGKAALPGEALGNFTATADREPVKWRIQWDDSRKKAAVPAGPMMDSTVSGWHVFKLPFKSGQTRTFRVSYDSPYSGSTFSISEDGHDSVEEFRYLFSTAAVWKGPIHSGKVVVRAASVDADKVVFNLPKRFKRTGDVWTWEFKDLEPTLADDMSIAVHPAVESWGRPLPGGKEDDSGSPRWVNYVNESGRWEMQHHLFKATASSTLPAQGDNSYKAQNVANYDKTWSEGAADDGIGESLTLKLDQPRKVSRIGIRNGYIKRDDRNHAHYYSNNRVAEFAISIDGGKPFTARIPDEPLARRLFFIPVPADTPPVSTIKLTIQKVVRGTNYRDTCVSEVWLSTPLAKKPKITPAR